MRNCFKKFFFINPKINKKMIGLIIDTESYPNLELIKCENKVDNLLFIVIPENIFKKLEIKKQGDERTSFFNSQEFIKNIQYHFCTSYDKKDNIVHLSGCDERHVQLFLDTIHLNFEESVRIVAPFNEKLIEKGFEAPEICGMKENDICLSRENKFINKNKIDPERVQHDLTFVKDQKNKRFCDINLQIDQPSLDFLKYLTKAGVTKTTKGRSQKEYFGQFSITETEETQGNILYTLSVDKDTLISGEEEKIEAAGSVYNFHTHPYEAYLNHKVKYGVPSISDYQAVFILSKQGTIIHFVATLEGVYAISMNPDFPILKKSDEKVIEFIDKKMPYARENLEKYLKYVNSVGLFQVELLQYKPTKIKAQFQKQGKFKNCVIRD